MQGKDVSGKKISVIGAARSGIAVAELLHTKGSRVFVSDSGNADKLASQISHLNSAGIEIETGKHSERVYDADVIVISPGVPSTSPVVLEAERRGIRIISELEAASWFCSSPVIAVTGSNGKTTTTTLIGRILSDAKKKHAVAGNIGTAFSSVVLELDQTAPAVLEVSSFQLDYIESFHPHVSVLLNITPDHLDRYGGVFERYIASKCRIFENQTKEDYLIYCFDDIETQEHVRRFASLHVKTLPFGIEQQFDEGAFVEDDTLVTIINGKRTEVVETGKISIKGIHNIYNSMAAALAAQVFDVSSASIRATLQNFKGVEHRLEFVREVNGVRYINDSKATNVDSVWYALQAFKEPVILLLGGRDKGNDYTKLYDLVEKNVKTIIAIGESAGTVDQEFSQTTKVVKAGSMEEAVRAATSSASSGDIVMLSPACASFDWFENYEHRGRVFKKLVNAL